MLKPEYLYRPQQLALRALHAFGRGPQIVTLPWGHKLTVEPEDSIGRAILNSGIYDLPVTEALWRLTDAGETALDVGANIGYTASVLAARSARVHAFEPHPEVFKRLGANVRALPNITTHQLALSDRDGEVGLHEPEGFAENCGLASVSDGGEITVECRRLDSLNLGRVQVMKLDVEGHEPSVLRGCEGAQIRDIVFEDHHGEGSPVVALLKGRGYEIFHLAAAALGPVLSIQPVARRPWEPPSLLATLNPFRAAARFRQWGWRSLGH